MIKYKFTIVGGDKRMAVLAKHLSACGQGVNTCYLFGSSIQSGVKIHNNVEKAISEADILILPMPISRDNIHVFSANKEFEVSVEDVLKYAKKYEVKHVFGGNINSEIRDIAKKVGVDILDYSLSEDFLQSNAYATAEGGMMIAMENTETTLRGLNVLVSGYGRIAKYLVDLLLSLGCRVTVAARSEYALFEAEASGCEVVDLNSFEDVREVLGKTQLIFNTVPSHIFNSEHIGHDNFATYIELASCPGGIDLRSARDAGMNIIFAPSLPGRYSPESAGEYIFDSISKKLHERGIFI